MLIYEYMDFEEVREEFGEEIGENLQKYFRDEERFEFFLSNERWRKLVVQ